MALSKLELQISPVGVRKTTTELKKVEKAIKEVGKGAKSIDSKAFDELSGIISEISASNMRKTITGVSKVNTVVSKTAQKFDELHEAMVAVNKESKELADDSRMKKVGLQTKGYVKELEKAKHLAEDIDHLEDKAKTNWKERKLAAKDYREEVARAAKIEAEMEHLEEGAKSKWVEEKLANEAYQKELKETARLEANLSHREETAGAVWQEEQLQNKQYRKEVKKTAQIERKHEALRMDFGEKLVLSMEPVTVMFEDLVGVVAVLSKGMMMLLDLSAQGAAIVDAQVNQRASVNFRGEAAGNFGPQGLDAASKGQLAVRTSRSGFEESAIRELMKVAEKAAIDKVATEGGNLAAVSKQMADSILKEFKTGELGTAFKQVGTSSAQFEEGLRKVARARGIAVESVDVATRRALMLSPALLESARSMDHLTVRAQRTRGQVDILLQGVKDQVAASLAGGLGKVEAPRQDRKTAEAADLKQFQVVESLKARLEDERARLTAKGAALDVESTLFSRLDRELEAATRTWRETSTALQTATRQYSSAAGQISESAIQGLTATTQMLEQTKTGSGVAGVAALDEVLESISAAIFNQATLAKAEVGLDGSSTFSGGAVDVGATELIAIGEEELGLLSERIAAGGLMNKETALNLLKQLDVNAALKLRIEMKARLYNITLNQNKVVANGLRQQLSTNVLLSKEARLNKVKALANLDFAESMRGQVDTQEEMDALLKTDRVERFKGLAVAKAMNDEEGKSGMLMSSRDKALNKATGQMLQLRLETEKYSSVQSEVHHQVAKGAIAESMRQGTSSVAMLKSALSGVDSKLKNQIKLADLFEKSMVKVVEVMHQIDGSTLGDDRLIKLFMGGKRKSEKKKSGRGKQKVDTSGFEAELLKRKLEREVETNKGRAAILDAMADINITQSTIGMDPAMLDAEGAVQVAQLQAWYADMMQKVKRDPKKQMLVMELRESRLMDLKHSLNKRDMEKVFDDYAKALSKKATALADQIEKDLRLEEEGRIRNMKLSLSQQTEVGRGAGGEAVESDRFISDEVAALKFKHVMLQEQRDLDLADEDMNFDQRLSLAIQYSDQILSVEQEITRRKGEEAAARRELILNEMATTRDAVMSFSSGTDFDGESEKVFQFGQVGIQSLQGIGSAYKNFNELQTKYEANDINAQERIAGNISSAVGASRMITAGLIKNKKAQAGVEGIFQIAEAAGAFASQQYMKGGAHLFAATQYFAVAGSSGGKGAKAARVRDARTSLSRESTIPQRRVQPTTLIHLFMDPFTGGALVSRMNESASGDPGNVVDGRLIPAGGAVEIMGQ